jgi:hypothetical protein
MTVKEYLSQAFVLDRLIKSRESAIEDLRDKLDYAGGLASGVKVQTSGKGDRMAELVAKLVDHITVYERDIKRLLDVKAEIKAVIDGVENPVYQLILMERYINLKRWEDIAADNYYNWNYLVYRLHPKILSKIKMLKKVKGKRLIMIQ